MTSGDQFYLHGKSDPNRWGPEPTYEPSINMEATLERLHAEFPDARHLGGRMAFEIYQRQSVRVIDLTFSAVGDTHWKQYGEICDTGYVSLTHGRSRDDLADKLSIYQRVAKCVVWIEE